MFQYQLNRISENLPPFIIIGFLAGLVVGFAEELENIEWLSWYLSYINVNINFKEDALSLFLEHFAPNTLLVILIAILLVSAIHRIVKGAVERKPSDKKGLIQSLENFGSLLAIAWLGLMIGVMFPAWYFEGWNSFLIFLVLAIYPVMFLIEVSVLLYLIHWEGIRKIPEYLDDRQRWRIGTRIEGVVILVAAILWLTFYPKIDALLQSAV